MRKQLTAAALIVALAVGTTACGKSDKTDQKETTALSGSGQENGASGENGSQGSNVSAGDIVQPASDDYFADGDYKDVTEEEADATITLSGSKGTISDTTRGSSGSEVTITSKGIYRITGSSEDVTIVVKDDQKSGNVYLVLDGVTMKNQKSACIRVESGDKVVLQCVGDNKLSFSGESGEEESAILSKDDLTINGEGALTVNSALHGIVAKDDLKITGATLSVEAGSIGIKGSDSVRIGGGTTKIRSGHDGIQVKNDDGNSFMALREGALSIEADYDGISVGTDQNAENFSGYIHMLGGTLSVTSGGGSDNSKDSNTSMKGVKCDGNIYFAGTEANVSSADDAVNSDSDIAILSGNLVLSSSDDGITTDDTLNITGGSVSIEKSYEGIEANYINISGGEISLVASDDGINTAGGSDSNSTEMGPWGASTDAALTISGGTLYVNASGDGIDSNGSLYVSGGTVIVEGPTGQDNGALDIGDSNDCVANITGGVVLAIGSTGMAVNFNDGTQCAGLVSLSGSKGTTITVDDGSDFSFTTSKNFECVVYSSPDLKEGKTYTVSAGSQSASLDFTDGLYYSTVKGMGVIGGMQGGIPGNGSEGMPGDGEMPDGSEMPSGGEMPSDGERPQMRNRPDEIPYLQ